MEEKRGGSPVPKGRPGKKKGKNFGGGGCSLEKGEDSSSKKKILSDHRISRNGMKKGEKGPVWSLCMNKNRELKNKGKKRDKEKNTLEGKEL